LDQHQAAAAVEELQVEGPPPQLVLPSIVVPPHRLLVVGDSVAQLLKPGFADEAPHGLTVQDGGMTFCGAGEAWPQMKIGISIIQDRCADWRTRWTSEATNMNADGTLIVFGVDSYTRYIDGAWRNPCDAEYDQWLQGAFADIMHTMQQFGPVWITLAPYDRATNSFGGPLAQRDAATDCANRDYQAAVASAAPNARAIDLNAFICPTGPDCIKQVDGVTLRPDGLHYKGQGADIVARWLLQQLGVQFPSG
jgi:SGNH domain (fused to AT3 domains)